jgi:hypothetical protein
MHEKTTVSMERRQLLKKQPWITMEKEVEMNISFIGLQSNYCAYGVGSGSRYRVRSGSGGVDCSLNLASK